MNPAADSGFAAPDLGLAPADAALYRSCMSELGARLKTLADKPEETAISTLAALWHTAGGRPMAVQLAVNSPLPALDTQGGMRLRELLRQRIDGVPLAHLTGRQLFMGVELIVARGALIPRDETGLLGNAALEKLRDIVRERAKAVVIDVCTGSGNLALALAHHEPHARIHGADVSADAVALARRNLVQTGLGDRVSFHCGDLLAPFDTSEFLGRVDLLVCNPPYISSGKVDGMPHEIIDHEPRLAFDGGPLGIRILERLVKEAPRFLRDGGWLAFEVGQGQGRGVARRLERQACYGNVAEIADSRGEVRALMASRLQQPAHATPVDR